MYIIAAGELTKKAHTYFCKVYYEEKAMLEWQVMFVFVKNLDALQQAIISYCIRFRCIILLQYIKKHHLHAEEYITKE